MLSKLGAVSAKLGKSLMKCKPIAKAAARISKNKPEILAGAGGVLIIAAFGLAIYEAIGVKEVMDDSAATVKAIEDGYSAKSEEEQKACEQEHKKELTKARVNGMINVGKRFIAPTAVLLVGLALKAEGMRTYRIRNIALATTLKGSEEFMKFYRQNVKDDLGEEADKKYAYGIQEVQEVKNEETGEIEKRSICKKRPNNPWRFEFSETYFGSATGVVSQDIFMLQCTEKWWQNELERYGDVSMYDILRYLHFKFDVYKDGMTRDQYAAFILFTRTHGWWIGSHGDQRVDLGIYRPINEGALRGHGDVVWMEMNCDGDFNKMTKDIL